MSKTAKIVQALKREDKTSSTPELRLSSGSTLINLACTDDASYAYTSGKYYFFVGDSQSGKTYLNLTMLAEAAINSDFDDYRLIYDDIEGGALMDISTHFGPRLADRLEVNHDIENLEHYYAKVDEDLSGDRPFIRITDSMDALRPKASDASFEDLKEALEKGKDAKGDYGTAKAKLNSNNLPRVISGLGKTGSILFLISQTRDNIGFGSQFQPKTRSGGTSLRFYATLEIWTSVKETLKKRVREKERSVGIRAQVEAKKNRQSGRKNKVLVPILHGCGLDDLGGTVEWLIDEGFWTESAKVITAPQFDFKGKMDSLVGKIEKEGRQAELRALAQGLWDEIEEGCRALRQSRYTSGE